MEKRLTNLIDTIAEDKNFGWVEILQKEFTQTEVFLVGGAVRDALMDRESYDFDFVVRNLESEKLEKFLSTHGEVNLVGKSFGVFIFVPTGSTLKEGIEIALPRTDASFNTGGYKDVSVTANPSLPIEKDLERRDFTVNALALNLKSGELMDEFDGQKDLQAKIIRAVGDPGVRFQEDYTRILRGVRLAAQLDFEIEDITLQAMKHYANKVPSIAIERVKDELDKILLSKNVVKAFELLKETQIINYLLPEIAEGIGVVQGKAHIYPVYEHLVRAAQHASEKEYSLPIIYAALFHDCGKPRTQKYIDGVDTYYQHEYVGEKMTRDTLNRLKYPKDFTKKVAHLVKNHMFYYNEGEISDAGIRRLIAKVGPEHIDDLLRLRFSDRIGMGRPKAKPHKLVEMERRVKILQTDPVTENMIKLDGNEMMEILKIKPSIRLKHLKRALLAEVLDDPKKNENEYLKKRVVELNKLKDADLIKLMPDIEEEEKERQRDLLKGFKGVE